MVKTRTIIEIESAEELVELALLSRRKPTLADDRPSIDPAKVTLVLEGRLAYLDDEDDVFQLVDGITPDSIIMAMAKHCNLKVHLT